MYKSASVVRKLMDELPVKLDPTNRALFAEEFKQSWIDALDLADATSEMAVKHQLMEKGVWFHETAEGRAIITEYEQACEDYAEWKAEQPPSVFEGNKNFKALQESLPEGVSDYVSSE